MSKSATSIEFLNPPELERRSPFEDPDEIRMSSWIRTWDREEAIDVGILAVPIARAAIRTVATNQGPNAMRDTRYYFTTYSIDFDVDAQNLKVRDLGDVEIPLMDVPAAHQRIYDTARTLLSLEPQFFPIFIGGDHSVTRPLINALRTGRPDLGKIGLVHFDGHLDAWRLDFEGPHNGTILRGLLDEGALDGHNIAQIGITGFANSEPYRRYLLDHGVTIFPSRDVARRGIDEIVQLAYEIASAGTDGVYVTFDIDCMDLAVAPGTGAAAPGGLTAWQAMEALFFLAQQEKVIGFDLVEVDPLRDVQMMTARLANKLLLTFLCGLSTRLNGSLAEER
jgi:formiminoglutamase